MTTEGKEWKLSYTTFMANTLNYFFASTFTEEETSNIPKPLYIFVGNSGDHLTHFTFTEDIALRQLQKLKTNETSDSEEFSSNILKDLADCL